MKAIINGIRYDTEKAQRLGEWSSGHPRTDFHRADEALYKTPVSGRYFLAGEGGGLSVYATVSGQGRGWGERIIPLSRREALEWAETHMNPDEVEAEFRDMIEDA
jgi:hypothetical protein